MTERNVYGKKSYEYALGRLSATTHRLLSAEQLGRLREADLRTAEKLLTEYGYPAVSEGQTVYDAIEAEKNAVCAFVREIAPDESLAALLFFEEDALNLKLLWKSKIIGKSIDTATLCEGSFDRELLRICVETETYSLLDDELDRALTAIEKETDPCRISCLIDNAVFAYAVSAAQKLHCKPLVQLFSVYGAGKNRLTAARLRALGLAPAEYAFAFLPAALPDEADAGTDAITVAEETAAALESVLQDLGYADGIGVLAQYYFRKKAEAAALRLLFTQKANLQERQENAV